MTECLPCSVAGTYFPADPVALRKLVNGYIAASSRRLDRLPKAIIAPHAGYDYSGPVAGAAYASLKDVGGPVRRVVLLGTCHVPGVRGLATTSAKALTTPLGKVSVDRAAVDAALQLPDDQVTIDDAAHSQDHSLQVQLPFLQVALEHFGVVPFLVGKANASAVASVVGMFACRSDTITVVSTDLSHYHDYQTAQKHDRETAAAILALDEGAIGPAGACGHVAVRGLVAVAKRLCWQCRLIELLNSGDAAAGRDRVVGYGAFTFNERFGKDCKRAAVTHAI